MNVQPEYYDDMEFEDGGGYRYKQDGNINNNNISRKNDNIHGVNIGTGAPTGTQTNTQTQTQTRTHSTDVFNNTSNNNNNYANYNNNSSAIRGDMTLNTLDFGVVARQIMLERWERQQALQRQMELQIQQEMRYEQERQRIEARLERKRRESKLLCYCLPYKLVGFFLCIAMGLCVGNALTPFLIWKTHYYKNNNSRYPNALNFMFSQTIGIYLFSTIIFLSKGLYTRLLHDKLKRPVMRPAIVSGIIWAVGFGGQLFAVSHLPYSVGYPICVIGPVLVSTLWSLAIFREIKGRHNISVLGVSILFSLLGILMLALSVGSSN